MFINKLLGSTLLATSVLAAVPAAAQSIEDQIKALSNQVGALQAELERLKAAEAEKAKKEVKISAKGAPEFSSGDFKFKVRGRVQADFGQVSGAEKFDDNRLGTTTEFRRARLGVEGGIKDWKYKFEADFADNEVAIKDAYVAWDGPVEVIVGNQNMPYSMEQITSSRFSTFMERAGFTNTFELDRLAGVSVHKRGEGYLLSAGAFSNGGLSGDSTKSGYTVAARGVYNPKIDGNQFHLGAWTLYRDKGAEVNRYRNRPLLHTTDVRFIDTGTLNTDSDFVYGVEAATIVGPFYAAAEYSGLSADLATPTAPGLDGSFHGRGGYVHAGYFLTGESLGYKASEGAFDRTKPAKPLGGGGMGALAVNLGLDYTDINDAGAGVSGGKQTGYLAGLTWIPQSYVRVIAQYGYIDVSGRSFSGVPVGHVDTFGLRTQIDW